MPLPNEFVDLRKAVKSKNFFNEKKVSSTNKILIEKVLDNIEYKYSFMENSCDNISILFEKKYLVLVGVIQKTILRDTKKYLNS